MSNEIDEESYLLLTDRFLKYIDEYGINSNTIKPFTNQCLVGLSVLCQQTPDGMNKYKKIKNSIDEAIIKKLKHQEKIHIVFPVIRSATWIGNELFFLLQKSERFVPHIIVCGCFHDATNTLLVEDYKELLAYFDQQPIDYMPAIDLSTQRLLTYAELGIHPDVCIWLDPWHSTRGDFFVYDSPLDVLNIYIPYSLPVDTIAQDNQHWYFDRLMWRVFCDSALACKEEDPDNFYEYTVFAGYPKLDRFYGSFPLSESIWQKVLDKSGNMHAKKIIWAPHHTLEDWEYNHYSTFAQNYRAMLDLAKEYEKDTVWIFRPHPSLQVKAIHAGIFKDESEWYAYLAEWNALSNAAVNINGDYADLMLNSDALIDDCVSFLAEYLFTENPLLFLDSGHAAFSSYGQQVIDCHYRTSGDNIAEIKHFINETVLGGHDPKKEKRKDFFDQNLNYKKILGMSSAEYIYRYLCKWLLP